MTSIALLGNMPVQVLNASYEPLAPTRLARAFALFLEGRAEFEEVDASRIVRHAGGEYKLPLVIRLLQYIKVPIVRAPVAFSKRELLKRDKEKCGYCGKKATTHDHIIPRSQGGDDSWMNAIAACSPCNSKKADRTPEQARMPLLFEPTIPYDFYFNAGKKYPKKKKSKT